MNDRFVAREINCSGDADGRLITVALLEILSRYQTVNKSYFHLLQRRMQSTAQEMFNSQLLETAQKPTLVRKQSPSMIACWGS